MNFNKSLAAVSAASLAIALSLSGCKSNPAPPANQPAATADSSQPASSQPSSMQPAADAPAGAPASQQATAPAPPPPPAVITLPAGTAIRVRLDTDLGSKISQPGDSFTASVADNILKDGEIVVPKGARAEGTVVDAKPLGRFKGGALLSVKLERVHTRWGSYPVATSSISRAEQGKGKRSAGFIGGGAGLGAIIGGIAGGGKGAAIGALAGGGAGTAGTAFTGNKQIVLPAESLLTFTLDHPVHITQNNGTDQSDQPALKTR
ncbi:hypothetical protein P8935_22295 [Telmatobacter sp. DSM 110680]|uniref:Uncharacterized protein n=1 Tax=Telmatobacter sp. DSM 110680 TaxID=3036704 RepID=A0AAU7DJ19_9BACT